MPCPDCSKEISGEPVPLWRQVKLANNKKARKKVDHCRPCSMERTSPDLKRSSGFGEAAGRTWGDLVDLSDIVSFDSEGKVQGIFFNCWVILNQGKAILALSQVSNAKVEVQFRILSGLLIPSLWRLFPMAAFTRRFAMEDQLDKLSIRLAEALEAKSDLENERGLKARQPGRTYKGRIDSVFRVAYDILDELSHSFKDERVQQISTVDVTILSRVNGSKQFLEELEGRSQPKTVETEESDDDAEEEPSEKQPVMTPTEAMAALPGEVRIIRLGSRGRILKKEQDRARKLLEKHGGLLDLSWRAATNSKNPKTVKLSGCGADPEAAKAAMMAHVEE